MDALFVVRERPFSKTLRVGSQLGIEQGRKWTFFVDSDLLLRPGLIERMLFHAEAQPARVCQVQGYCLDKFFGGARIGGIHLYRTSLLSYFIDSIPKEGADIRPETRALKTMASKGFPWVIVPELIGLHGFEQSYEDIFRTCFVHAHKHSHLLDLLVPFWKSQTDLDADYAVALAGFAAGIEHPGSVRINKDAPYFLAAMERLHYREKPKLSASAWTLSRVEGTIKGWKEPSSYWEHFPVGMIGSGSSLFSRAVAALRAQVGARGPARGTFLWLSRVFLLLSKKL